MIKNFKRELDLMKSNKNISDKLMIFSLYNEFYNEAFNTLSLDEIGMLQYTLYYESFMEKTFELIVACLNLQDNVSVNAEEFMKKYFKVLKCSKISKMPKIASIISHFENDLGDFISASKYVNVIDGFASIPLDAKVKIMAEFREYINNVFVTCVDLYDVESSKELRHSILDMLISKLEEYLKNNLANGVKPNRLSNNLKETMMISTKEYLINKLKKGEFGFDAIEDQATRKFFTNFGETEKKIILMCAIYSISDYDKLTDEERMNEICEILNISKPKYLKAIASIGARYFTLLGNSIDETDYETFDGDSLNLRRK